FNFSATIVPQEIHSLLRDQGLSMEDIDYFCLHQGSQYIIDAIRTRLKIPPEKVPIKLKDQGNTVSSSIALLLEDIIGNNSAHRIMLCGFGVGLSVATCLLERSE